MGCFINTKLSGKSIIIFLFINEFKQYCNMVYTYTFDIDKYCTIFIILVLFIYLFIVCFVSSSG